MSTVARALQADSLLLSHQGNAMYNIVQRRELSSVLCGDLNGKQIQKRADICTQEKAMAPHFSTLAWKIPWTEEPGRLQSMGSLRVGHD